jgi:hypothetical protein
MYFSTFTGILYSSFISPFSVWVIYSTDIPNYDRIFTSADINTLNSRPDASHDFKSGVTTAIAGDTYVFGSDIGYNSTAFCPLNYWPPGPVCPEPLNSTVVFPLRPAPEMASGQYIINIYIYIYK